MNFFDLPPPERKSALTVRVPENVLARVKALAKRKGRTTSATVVGLLRVGLQWVDSENEQPSWTEAEEKALYRRIAAQTRRSTNPRVRALIAKWERLALDVGK